MSGENPSEREETEQERLNRQLDQLLNELRVAMPGVQVLFAFLLTVAVPAALRRGHRLPARRVLRDAAGGRGRVGAVHRADRLPPPHVPRARQAAASSQISSKLALAGLACLAIAMNGAVLLVTDVLFERHDRRVTVALTATLYIGLWFVLGLVAARGRSAQPLDDDAPAAILDIDGTLVDSNYQHALAWYRAFRLHGITIPVWRCHRAIGMGGDQLVPYLAGEGFDREQGDAVRARGARALRSSSSTRCSRSPARAG